MEEGNIKSDVEVVFNTIKKSIKVGLEFSELESFLLSTIEVSAAIVSVMKQIKSINNLKEKIHSSEVSETLQ